MKFLSNLLEKLAADRQNRALENFMTRITSPDFQVFTSKGRRNKFIKELRSLPKEIILDAYRGMIVSKAFRSLGSKYRSETFIEGLRALSEGDRLSEYKEMINLKAFNDMDDADIIGGLTEGLYALPEGERLEAYKAVLNSKSIDYLRDKNIRGTFVQCLDALPDNDTLEGYKATVASEIFKSLDGDTKQKSFIELLSTPQKNDRLEAYQTMLNSKEFKRLGDEDRHTILMGALKILPRGNQVIMSVKDDEITLYCPKGSVEFTREIALEFNKSTGAVKMLVGKGVEWSSQPDKLSRSNDPEQGKKMVSAFKRIVGVAHEASVDISQEMTAALNTALEGLSSDDSLLEKGEIQVVVLPASFER